MRRKIARLCLAAVLLVCPAGMAAAGDAATGPDPRRIDALIAQLGDDDYFVRERAQQELAKVGFSAFDALSAAEDDEDIEIAARARFLVRQMQIEWTVESDPPEVKRLLQNYAQKDDAAHLTAIEQLAELEDDKGLAVLCRLVRFERSPVLSKVAALAVIEGQQRSTVDWTRRERAIDDNLGPSTRPGAQWLHSFALAHRDPAAAAGQWASHAEVEEKVLKESPQKSQPAFAAALWRQRVELLKGLSRRDEAVAAMLRVVALDDENDSLVELIDWLTRDRAWSNVNDVAARFTDRFQRDPMLLYSLADSCKSQGNEEAAQRHADKAVQLNQTNPLQHLRVAVELQRRGKFDWSEREYRRSIKIGDPRQLYTRQARFLLAEMQYDRADYKAAAVTLEEVVRSFQGQAKEGIDQEIAGTGRTVELVTARMHFFRACQHEAAGERDKQVAELKAGLEQAPTEVDVLIALFHVPDLDPALREKTRKLIAESAESFRQEIKESPDDATPYNQLAWLIANTEGDKQEALKASQKSLELRPGAAGFLDTLARCYFALGDVENAVKNQERAVELDPHSGQMTRQLALFREALAKSKLKGP